MHGIHATSAGYLATTVCFVLLLPGCVSPQAGVGYGALDDAGDFRFHDASAARAFGEAHGERLCVRATADGEYAWEARLPADLPAQIVPAYLDWYRQRFPDDSRWGLADCPSDTRMTSATLAGYGRWLDPERFVFASPARAVAFWGSLQESGLVCLRDGVPATRRPPAPQLALALAALDYWRRAGVVRLTGQECSVPETP